MSKASTARRRKPEVVTDAQIAEALGLDLDPRHVDLIGITADMIGATRFTPGVKLSIPLPGSGEDWGMIP
jgi:hypothetical protein